MHVVVSTIHTHPANLCHYQSTMLIYFYAHFVAGKCCLTTIIPTLDSSKPRSQRSRLRPGPHLCSLETKTTYLGGVYQACTKHHLYSVSNFWKTAFGAEKSFFSVEQTPLIFSCIFHTCNWPWLILIANNTSRVTILNF